MIYQERWKIIKSYQEQVYLKNIYNNRLVVLSADLFKKVERGEASIDKLIANKIRKQQRQKFFEKNYYRKEK